MIKVDLITGFLGSGKTTFMRCYAKYLITQKMKIGIIVNDFGAVNVDMMLLQELPVSQCQIEMIAGGCDKESYRRRLKTKLIALKMQGIERVLIEPSGLFDIEDFFDCIHDEPIDQWYEPGSVIAIAEKEMKTTLSSQSAQMLAEQLLSAGRIVVSKVDHDDNREEMIAKLQRFLRSYSQECQEDDIIYQNWDTLTDEEFEQLVHCGYKTVSLPKVRGIQEELYQTVYLMNQSLNREQVRKILTAVMKDPECGSVYRVKGFVTEDGEWFEINAVPNDIDIRKIDDGQDIIIVIGEHLSKQRINAYFQ